MELTRRKFLVTAGCAGAAVMVTSVSDRTCNWAAEPLAKLAPYRTGMRMAATPATDYRAYRSKTVTDPNLPTWVQIDLGKTASIDRVVLYPASERGFPGRDQYYAGEGFPLRFRIEASEDPEFLHPQTIADLTGEDFPDPEDNITQYAAHDVHARFIRVTATRLRPVKESPAHEFPMPGELTDSPDYTLTLAKIGVISQGADIAVGCKAISDDKYGTTELLSHLTRPARQDGEEIHRDNPAAVTDASGWKPPKFKARAPRTGVTLAGGVFETAMRNNIQYLLNSYTTEELLRQFYERAGKIPQFKAKGPQVFWEEDLAGSNAGRFLMGAGNTLRWINDPELHHRLEAVVNGIEECKQPNGYIMAYSEDSIFYSERAAYTRAWLTHGLLEAAYYGNEKALPMLRGYYDWFNQQSFLPEMLRGAIQGGQGMVANTRVALSPVGKAADAQVIQRYYQEDNWLHGLARREKEQVWQYPYDRPHCYLLTNLEAYLDMYLVTGEPLYFDAVEGAWELYRAHWEEPGGSISIIEFQEDPPDSNFLSKQRLGELCGNSFWVFLSQRFQQLNPDQERYAAEIEKSIYNVAIANQDGTTGLRYHTLLEGKKENSTHQNTCCEGQGTRLLGSLPEHIYSIAEDGLYLHLYEPSSITWKHNGQEVRLKTVTRFPFAAQVECHVSVAAPARFKLRVRTPLWAKAEMPIKVNGKVSGTGTAGSYCVIDREWKEGDVVEFALPIGFTVTPYKGAEQLPGRIRYSVEYGPVLYAAVGSDRIDLPQEFDAARVEAVLEPIAGEPLHFRLRGDAATKLIPYWEVGDERFTCFLSKIES